MARHTRGFRPGDLTRSQWERLTDEARRQYHLADLAYWLGDQSGSGTAEGVDGDPSADRLLRWLLNDRWRSAQDLRPRPDFGARPRGGSGVLADVALKLFGPELPGTVGVVLTSMESADIGASVTIVDPEGVTYHGARQIVRW